jgi:hypothetical protein
MGTANHNGMADQTARKLFEGETAIPFSRCTKSQPLSQKAEKCHFLFAIQYFTRPVWIRTTISRFLLIRRS